MGIICEFYCLENETIINLIDNPKDFEYYLTENHTNPDSENHLEGENFFYLDKAWDIAMFLLRQNDSSSEKLLSKLEGEPIHEEMDGFSIINLQEVKSINQILSNISENEIENTYNIDAMEKANVYRARWFTKNDNWQYILNHVKTIQQAFMIASQKNQVIIVRKG
jgi:hypothetical protein